MTSSTEFLGYSSAFGMMCMLLFTFTVVAKRSTIPCPLPLEEDANLHIKDIIASNTTTKMFTTTLKAHDEEEQICEPQLANFNSRVTRHFFNNNFQILFFYFRQLMQSQQCFFRLCVTLQCFRFTVNYASESLIQPQDTIMTSLLPQTINSQDATSREYFHLQCTLSLLSFCYVRLLYFLQ